MWGLCCLRERVWSRPLGICIPQHTVHVQCACGVYTQHAVCGECVCVCVCAAVRVRAYSAVQCSAVCVHHVLTYSLCDWQTPRARPGTEPELELRRWRGRALLSAICKCIVEPVSSSSSEALLPSRCLHRAATALVTCSSDSFDEAAAAAGFFEPLGDLAFLELLAGAAAGCTFDFFTLAGAGAAAGGVAAVAAAFRFFGFSTGVGAAVAGSLTALRFLGLSTAAGAGLLGILRRRRSVGDGALGGARAVRTAPERGATVRMDAETTD